MLLNDILQVFRLGKQVADPATWKKRALAINALSGLLVAIGAVAKGFGYDFHLDQATLEAAAGGIVALLAIYNAVVTVVSSTKVGLPPKPGALDGVGTSNP